MGKWHQRAVTLLVTAMIAGGQTVIVLCDAWCVAHSHTTSAEIAPNDLAQNAHHHHAADNQPGASRPDLAVDAGTHHAHQQASGSTMETSRDAYTLLNLSSPDCCTMQDAGPATLAAARPDNLVLLASSATHSFNPVSLDSSHRLFGPPTHAPPPGELSSTPTPLRI